MTNQHQRDFRSGRESGVGSRFPGPSEIYSNITVIKNGSPIRVAFPEGSLITFALGRERRRHLWTKLSCLSCHQALANQFALLAFPLCALLCEPETSR